MKLKHRLSCWFAALAASVIVGCEANHYEIEMKPAGTTVQRELTCWRERAANDNSEVVVFPEVELARIAAAYDTAVPAGRVTKHKFVKAFSGAMPQDLGGSGSYTHWKTSLGSVSAYVERVRGNDDLLADVESRHAAVDRIVDVLTGWLASELEGEAGFAELREFLKQRFRRDLKNLSLYAWVHATKSDKKEAALSECLVRVGQYLVERAYFTPEQLPALTRAVQELDRAGPARLLALLQRFTALKMGIAEDQPIPACLQFLSDLSVLEASFDEYIRKTDDFQRALAEWNRDKRTNPGAKEPEPEAVIDALVGQAFLSTFQLGRPDRFGVKLAATTKPFQTNGQWDDQAQQVKWSHDILAADAEHPGFPSLLYAVWSSPDEPAQKAKFGRLVLEGEALGKYCLWYRSLSEREAREWDEFVASLRPSDELTERLHSFRFSHETRVPEGGDGASNLAATPRELILRSLSDEGAAR